MCMCIYVVCVCTCVCTISNGLCGCGDWDPPNLRGPGAGGVGQSPSQEAQEREHSRCTFWSKGREDRVLLSSQAERGYSSFCRIQASVHCTRPTLTALLSADSGVNQLASCLTTYLGTWGPAQLTHKMRHHAPGVPQTLPQHSAQSLSWSAALVDPCPGLELTSREPEPTRG